MSTTDIRTKANEIIAICDAMDATPPNTGGTVHGSFWFLVEADGTLKINSAAYPAVPYCYPTQQLADQGADGFNRRGGNVTAVLCNIAS